MWFPSNGNAHCKVKTTLEQLFVCMALNFLCDVSILVIFSLKTVFQIEIIFQFTYSNIYVLYMPLDGCK